MFFLIEISGNNFLIDIDNEISKVGFFVSRTVAASTEADAINIAVSEIVADLKVKAIVHNNSDDKPFFDIERVTPVTESRPASGYVFFRE